MTAPQQQKLRVNGPVVITANRLSDGKVVYRAQSGSWTSDLAAAAVVRTAEEAMALLAEAAADATLAVGAYVAPVILDSGTILPGNLREFIRQRGPTFPLPS